MKYEKCTDLQKLLKYKLILLDDVCGILINTSSRDAPQHEFISRWMLLPYTSM
jgi:hypothetical protein